MASLRPPSADTRLTRDQRSPSPRSRDHDVHDGQSLPGGSSLFQEVMAELHPPSPSTPIPKSPAARRRKSSQVKHVHYAMDTGGRRKKEEPPLSQQEDGEEEEEEVAGPEKQILHGKCHCYFVEHGNVTGLADHHCHHQHRLLHPLQASPMSSPRPSRKTTSTPEGSPPSRNKHHHPNHHHNHHHHTSLQLPEADSFRGRSHSDCAVMARVCKSKKAASLSPSSFSSSSSSSRGKTSPVRGGTPDKIRVPPIRRSASLRHDGSEVRSESALSALRISSPLPPPPILVQDASDPGGERRGRRPSTHSVDSQQLHYLYDQFLSPGSGGSSSGHG